MPNSNFTGKLVDIAYGVKKLQISCVIEDDKVIYEPFNWSFFLR